MSKGESPQRTKSALKTNEVDMAEAMLSHAMTVEGRIENQIVPRCIIDPGASKSLLDVSIAKGFRISFDREISIKIQVANGEL